MEPDMNEQQGLQLIESMINKAKNNFSESGTLYLVWGFAILVCSLVQFVGVYFFNNYYTYNVWFLTWAVFIYQVIFLAKKQHKTKVRTYTDDIIKDVWIGFVVAMFLVFVLLMFRNEYYLIHSSILVLYGIPTFLSGKILKVPSLALGGIFCWVLAFASAFTHPQFHVLLISLAVVCAWIIPGFYLRKKFLTLSQNNGR